MVLGGTEARRKFRTRVLEWRNFPGKKRTDGTLITKPKELSRIQLIDALAKRYQTIPSVVQYEFDAMDTFHRVQVLEWAEGEVRRSDDDDDEIDDDAPRPGSVSSPGMIDVPDWLLADIDMDIQGAKD